MIKIDVGENESYSGKKLNEEIIYYSSNVFKIVGDEILHSRVGFYPKNKAMLFYLVEIHDNAFFDIISEEINLPEKTDLDRSVDQDFYYCKKIDSAVGLEEARERLADEYRKYVVNMSNPPLVVEDASSLAR